MDSFEPTIIGGDGMDPRLLTGQGVQDPFMQAMDEALRKAPAGFVMDNAYVDKRKAENPNAFLAPSGPVYAKASSVTSSSTQGSSITGADAFRNLQTQMEIIGKTADPTEKQKLLIGMEASAGSYLSEKSKEARILAEQQLGIAALREQITVNEQLDRKDPQWQKFQADSKITTGARQRLLQAEAQVDTHAKRLLGENGELQRFIQTVNGMTALQRSLIQKQEGAAATAGQKAEQSLALINTISPEVRKSLELWNPALAQPENLISWVTTAAKSGKESASVDALLQGQLRPDNYLDAGLGGNTIAMNLAAVEQAARTGLSKDVVYSQLKTATADLLDPEKFKSIAPTLGIKKDVVNQENSKLLMANAKEKAEILQGRLRYIAPYIARLQQDNIDGDITNWPKMEGVADITTLPGAMPVIEQIRNQTGKGNISLADFARAYTTQPNLKPEEVAQRTALLSSTYDKVLDKVNSGVYATQGIDKARARTALDVAMASAKAKSNPARRVGQEAAKIVDTALQYQSPAQRLFGVGASGAGSALSDVYRGFVGE